MLIPAAAKAPESLSTRALCVELERLARQERQTEWLLCRHLAVLYDRVEKRDPLLAAYADIYQLARLRLGMGVRLNGRARGQCPLALPTAERHLLRR